MFGYPFIQPKNNSKPIAWDDKGNCYEELDPNETMPMETYVWFYNNGKPITKHPERYEKFGSLDKIKRITERYKAMGMQNAVAKLFSKRSPPEEECKSPGCKRRMKNAGRPCHWCGRI